MYQKLLYLITTVLIFSVLSAFPVNAADLGNFNDYDSGSDWDSDSGWNDDYSSDWDDDDDDYSYSSGYSGGSSSGGGGGGSLCCSIPIVVIIIIVILISSRKKGKNNNTTPGHNNVNPTPNPGKPHGKVINLPNYTEQIVPAITAIDPDFSYDKFVAWTKEVFITLQTAWSERDISKARPFEKEELYTQHQTQINEYINRGWINVLERINVNNAHLYRYTRDAEYEHLTVFMQARMTDYIKDETSNQVIKGDPYNDCFMQYLYTFTRKTGVLTSSAKSQNSIVACPHCGAPTQITSAGKCEYCGFIVTTGEFSWVLSNIEGVKSNVTPVQGGVFIKETPVPANNAQNNKTQPNNTTDNNNIQ